MSITVSAYGIGNGSTLHMVGAAECPPSKNTPAAPREAPQRATEPELISKINEELQQTRRSLVPSLDAFLGTLDSSTQSPTSELEREHVRLGELLLQSLLRLDALMPEGTWEDARTLRKGAVREVQGLLDRLDDGWRACKIKLVR
jgi:BAG domain